MSRVRDSLRNELQRLSDLWHATSGLDSKIWARAYDECIKILEEAEQSAILAGLPVTPTTQNSRPGRFQSPLIRRIAWDNKVTQDELDRIPGTGNNDRVVRKDLMAYIAKRKAQ